MKKETKRNLSISISLLTAFILWTALVRIVDRQAIGPQGSTVGFATLNECVHEFFGVHMSLYTLTDGLGVVPIGIILCFALLGLIQWIKRQKLLSVDRNILALGVFYVAVFAIFLLFEMFVINYRPVLIDGALEASYPSSTTMLAMCVMPTAMMQFKRYVKSKVLKVVLVYSSIAFTVFMVMGRMISGVHWITDIIGGALISAGLVMMYYTYQE